MKVSIIPQDNVIVVDGVACNPVDAVYPPGVKAIQWNGTEGTIEYANGSQEHLTDFDGVVQTFVTLHSITSAPGVIVPGMTPRQEIAAKLAERGLTQLWQVYSAMAGMLALGGLSGKTEAQLYEESPGYANAKDTVLWIEAKALEHGITDI